MLKPLKDIPFNAVVKGLTGKEVLFFNHADGAHKELLKILKLSMRYAGKQINKNGINRTRPNEVGNDVEKIVIDALTYSGIKAGVPQNKRGHRVSAGYPDISFVYKNVNCYAECKTYNIGSADTAFRSFYFSPSKNSKITQDAVHLLLSFEMYVAGEYGNSRVYKCRNYKILSIESLSLDVKHEFNSDNKRLYSGKDGAVLLAEGKIQ
ncbi:MAG: hypothetical protein LBO62_03480 [Endomicrobium sp.]|nr:hypothetical protein [Endomicrobium sp.]